MIWRTLILSSLLVGSLFVKGGIAGEVTHFGQKVLYSSKVPDQIRRKVNGTGTTRFYGESFIQGRKVAFHFYNTRRPKNLRGDAMLANLEQEMQFDIFTRTQQQNRTVFQRVKALPLTFVGFPRGKLSVALNAMWLDPKVQTIPLLKLNLESQISTGGMVGNEVLFVFPKGLKGSVAEQSFYYDFLEGPVPVSGNDFGRLDSRGYLTRTSSSMDGINRELIGLNVS